MALLTIAIPTVNRIGLLKQAVLSALSQSADVEIIISDNGSLDGTSEFLASLTPAPNLRLYRHEQTMPVQDHGAFLVSQIRTDWVVFLSDDDYLEAGFCSAVLDVISEKPDVALVYTGCNMTFGDIAVPAKVGPRFERGGNFFYEFMNGHRNICMCATAFRIGDWRAIGPQPRSRVIGDMYYWSRILAEGGTVGCAAGHFSNYSFYRPGGSTETNRTPVAAWVRESEELADIMCASIARMESGGYSPASVVRVRRKYLALTTSNHFAWNALRGARKWKLFASFIALIGVIFGDLTAPPRAVAAIILPPRVLEWRLLSHARRLAAADKP